ncbi:hypothetical protein [Streptomyces platensis]|uniref:hypothetical protein n=1 Tax=Streptomyces platensis TaxID=58346 RepID=UPI00399D72A8
MGGCRRRKGYCRPGTSRADTACGQRRPSRNFSSGKQHEDGTARSLVAVTARSNREKADQDPAEWTPPAADAQCTYLSDWVGTKLRWSLTVDRTERDTLRQLAAGCEDTDVEYERV